MKTRPQRRDATPDASSRWPSGSQRVQLEDLSAVGVRVLIHTHRAEGDMPRAVLNLGSN